MIAEPTRGDIDLFRRFLEQRFGLSFDDAKVNQLAEVLTSRVRETGMTGFASYFARLGASPEELRALAKELTVGETYFFRYPDHFAAFTELALPECVRRHSLRILSAGCASGEELYTLAILVRESVPDLDACNVTLTGIDINVASLEKARRGRYSPWSLRGTPEAAKERYFREEAGGFQLIDAIRSAAHFEERNLLEDDNAFWRPGRFDVIFCRNVIIYLSPDAIRTLVARLARSLAPSGFLFLGHAETLRGVSQEFHLRHTHDTFYYQRRSDDAPGASRPPSTTATAFTHTVPGSVAPIALAADETWVDAIRHASERIAALTAASPGAATNAAPSQTAAQAATWSLAKAMDLFQQERFGEAMENLMVLPAEAALNSDVQLLRAALLTNSGDLVAANKVCTQLLAQDELNAGAHYLTALGREHAGDRAGAIQSSQTAAYLDREFAMPHLHLGLLAKKAGDVEGARRELEQAVLLLSREDASRILLFGGGFTRESLLGLCRAELRACGGKG